MCTCTSANDLSAIQESGACSGVDLMGKVVLIIDVYGTIGLETSVLYSDAGASVSLCTTPQHTSTLLQRRADTSTIRGTEACTCLDDQSSPCTCLTSGRKHSLSNHTCTCTEWRDSVNLSISVLSDISSREVQAAISGAVKTFGRLDIIIFASNNAEMDSSGENKADNWRKLIRHVADFGLPYLGQTSGSFLAIISVGDSTKTHSNGAFMHDVDSFIEDVKTKYPNVKSSYKVKNPNTDVAQLLSISAPKRKSYEV